MPFSEPSENLSRITDFTALPTIIFSTTFFILVWSWIKKYVAANGPIRGARGFISVNNKIYAAFSLVLAVGIANATWVGLEANGLGESCRYAYHFSKFYEYLDVLLLVASGVGVNPYMAFHHITTPFYTHFRVLHASNWQLFAFLNCFHHVLLYSYLGGAKLLRPLLPYTQYLQLGAGVAFDAFYLIQHGKGDAEQSTGRVVSILLLLRYAQLYTESQTSPPAQKPIRDTKSEQRAKPVFQERDSKKKKRS